MQPVRCSYVIFLSYVIVIFLVNACSTHVPIHTYTTLHVAFNIQTFFACC